SAGPGADSPPWTPPDDCDVTVHLSGVSHLRPRSVRVSTKGPFAVTGKLRIATGPLGALAPFPPDLLQQRRRLGYQLGRPLHLRVFVGGGRGRLYAHLGQAGARACGAQLLGGAGPADLFELLGRHPEHVGDARHGLVGALEWDVLPAE